MTLDASKAKSAFLREMIGRGHVYQITDESGLDEYAANGVATGYIGFDCTAKSLHVGSLVQIMNLRRLQQAGGKPIVLMGGGTTKIGDPTDKEKSRPILTTEEIAANMAKSKYAALIMSLVHAGKPVTEDEMLEAASDMTKNRKTARSGLSYARTHLENGRIIRSLGNGLWIKT